MRNFKKILAECYRLLGKGLCETPWKLLPALEKNRLRRMRSLGRAQWSLLKYIFKQIFSFDFLILFSRGCFLISQDSFNFVVVLQRTLRFWWCRVPCHAYEIRTEKYITSKCQWPEVVFLTGLMMSSLEGVIEWALSYHVKLELSSRFQSLSHYLLLKNVDSSTKPFLPCSNHISFKSWCLSIR